MHQKNPSHATFIASNCTSLSNHIYIIVSFILFGFMAFSMHSGKSISTITALSPAPSTITISPSCMSIVVAAVLDPDRQIQPRARLLASSPCRSILFPLVATTSCYHGQVLPDPRCSQERRPRWPQKVQQQGRHHEPPRKGP